MGTSIEIECLQKPLLLRMPLGGTKTYAYRNNASIRCLSAVIRVANDYDRLCFLCSHPIARVDILLPRREAKSSEENTVLL